MRAGAYRISAAGDRGGIPASPPRSSSPQVRGVCAGAPGPWPRPGPGLFPPVWVVSAVPAGCRRPCRSGRGRLLRPARPGRDSRRYLRLSAAAVPWRGRRLGSTGCTGPGTVRDRRAAGARRAGAAHRVRPGTLRTCWPPPGCVNLRLESWCWRELWSSARHLRRCWRQPPVSTPSRLRMNDRALDRFIFYRREPFTLRLPCPRAHLRLVPDRIHNVALPSPHTFASAVSPAVGLTMWLIALY